MIPTVDIENSQFLIIADRNDESPNYQYGFFSSAFFITQELICKYRVNLNQISILFPFNFATDIVQLFDKDAYIDLGIRDRIFKFQIPNICMMNSFSSVESIKTTPDTELYIFLFNHGNIKISGKNLEISYTQLLSTLHKLPHKKIVILNDCCQSGSLIDLYQLTTQFQQYPEQTQRFLPCLATYFQVFKNEPDLIGLLKFIQENKIDFSNIKTFTSRFSNFLLHIIKNGVQDNDFNEDLVDLCNCIKDCNIPSRAQFSLLYQVVKYFANNNHDKKFLQHFYLSTINDIVNYLSALPDEQISKLFSHLQQWAIYSPDDPLNPQLTIENMMIFASCPSTDDSYSFPLRDFTIGNERGVVMGSFATTIFINALLINPSLEGLTDDHIKAEKEKLLKEIGNGQIIPTYKIYRTPDFQQTTFAGLNDEFKLSSFTSELQIPYLNSSTSQMCNLIPYTTKQPPSEDSEVNYEETRKILTKKVKDEKESHTFKPIQHSRLETIQKQFTYQTSPGKKLYYSIIARYQDLLESHQYPIFESEKYNKDYHNIIYKLYASDTFDRADEICHILSYFSFLNIINQYAEYLEQNEKNIDELCDLFIQATKDISKLGYV